MKAMRHHLVELVVLAGSAVIGLEAAPDVDHREQVGDATAHTAPPKADPLIATWEDDVLDILEALKGKATSSNQIVAGRAAAQLSTSERATINAELDEIISYIADAQVPISANDPGLSIPGCVDSSVNPQSLAEYAATLQALSVEAHSAVAAGPSFDRVYVGTRLKTMYSLITRTAPHSFRSKLDSY